MLVKTAHGKRDPVRPLMVVRIAHHERKSSLVIAHPTDIALNAMHREGCREGEGGGVGEDWHDLLAAAHSRGHRNCAKVAVLIVLLTYL